MKIADLKKQINILYIIVLVLIFVTVGGFVYMEYRISDLSDKADTNMQLSITSARRLSNAIKLNKLDTDQCQYIINSNDWEEVLSNNSGGLSIYIPDDWQLSETEIYKCVIESDDTPLYEFTILLNVGDVTSFNDFVNNMYYIIRDLDYNDIVQSFNKEKGGYYEIESFDEATYGNMYFDYITINKDGMEEGPRTKVKILYLEDSNQVKIEVNKY